MSSFCREWGADRGSRGIRSEGQDGWQAQQNATSLTVRVGSGKVPLFSVRCAGQETQPCQNSIHRTGRERPLVRQPKAAVFAFERLIIGKTAAPHQMWRLGFDRHTSAGAHRALFLLLAYRLYSLSLARPPHLFVHHLKASFACQGVNLAPSRTRVARRTPVNQPHECRLTGLAGNPRVAVDTPPACQGYPLGLRR